MFDNAQMLDLFEQALDHEPVCTVCSAPTDIRDRGGRLWLECSTTPIEPPTGLIDRLGAALAPHPRRLIADLREDLAA
jgi:hypothetical protein